MTYADLWTLVTIAGMMLISVFTRSLFFVSSKPWQLPPVARAGSKYAPIAALAAVVIPEIVATSGHMVHTWKDARLFATSSRRRGISGSAGLLGTIVAGMAVYLPLHLGLGW